MITLEQNINNKIIDLRSDTVTLPTNEMREAMQKAKVGDDVYQEDPTINRLEEIAAKKIGKEKALFVPSGTMGNLLAVLTHCKRGEDAILEANSHIYYEEVGGMSAVAGVSPRLVVGERGVLNPEEVKKAIRGKDIHFSKTTLICLENTHNMAGGTVTPLQIMEEICEIAHQSGIPIHLDGARLFNAALALGVKPVLFTKNFDSIMFCLSKGLGAPVGSILAGSKEFIQKARKNRKMLGGGMRQAGILAAAGIIALEKMVERLQVDHERAFILGKSLNKIEGIDVDLETLQTNMVYFDIKKSGLDTFQFLSKLEKNNILGYPRPPTKVRFVTHYGISEEDIYTTIEVVKEILKN